MQSLALGCSRVFPRMQSRPIFRSLTPQYRQMGKATSQPAAGNDAPPPKPKPKATTSLRRAASASIPIRSNPTPTRGSIQPISTICTAERYVLPRLKPLLPASARMVSEAWWIPHWGEGGGKEGEIFVFGNGSVVCWGLDEEEARVFAIGVLGRNGIEVGRLIEDETEELEFVTDPTEETRLQGDLIILGHAPELSSDYSIPHNLPKSVLPSQTLAARYAFSQALARSTALSALESSIESYLSSVSALPDSLTKTGKPGLKRKELIMKLGELMKFRQGLNLNRENFADTPDFYWTEPVLEAYFNSMSDALEIKTRANSLNSKITYAAEVQSMLRELLAEASSHKLEWIIIILIAVEVVIAIVRDGPELWHMLFKSKSEEKKTDLEPSVSS